jgi:hypothetical protein
MQIHARVDIRSCSGRRKFRDSAAHRAEPGRRCAAMRLAKYLGQNTPKLKRAVDIARSGILMVEFLGKAGLIPATVLVREIDPSGGRRRRPRLAGTPSSHLDLAGDVCPSAGEDPMARGQEHARLQLARSGRDCVTLSRPAFSLRARSCAPLYAVPCPVGWGDPSTSCQCARPERSRRSRGRDDNGESQSDRWCGSDGLWRNRGCLGEQPRPRPVSKVSI